MPKLRFNWKSLLATQLLFFSSCQERLNNHFLPNTNQIENLSVLCKVWGFLKYHDNRVRSGQYDWDSILVQSIPQILSCKSAKERNLIFIRWTNSLGKVSNLQLSSSDSAAYKLSGKLITYMQDESAKKVLHKADLTWLSDTTLLSPELSHKLIEILRSKRKAYSHYVSVEEETGTTLFDGEQKYKDMLFPDVNYRLLALFRLWNAIEYYSPYKYLIHIV